MASEIATAYVSLIPSFRGGSTAITKELTGAAGPAGAASGKVAGTGFRASLKQSMKGVSGIVTSAVAGAAVVNFFKGAITAASQAEQSIGGAEAVFGKFSKTVVKNSKDAATEFGLSANQYRESANLIGALFKNQGVATDQLAGKTDEMIGVAADLSASFGGTTKQAVEALGSAFKGEFDPLEQYGISLKQSTVNSYLAANGQDNLTGAAKKQAEQQAITAIVMKQAGSSLGQFGRETGTAAGQQQILTAKWENAKATLGNALLPAFTAVAGFLSDKVVPAFANVAKWVQQNISWLGPLAGALLAAAAAWKIVNLVMRASPWAIIIALVAAVVTFLIANWQTAMDFLAGIWNWIKGVATTVWNAIASFFTGLWSSITGAITTAWNAIGDFFTTIWNGIKSVALTVWNSIAAFFTTLWAGIKAAVVAVWNWIYLFYSTIFNAIWTVVRTIWNGIKLFFSTLWTAITTAITTAWNAIKSFLSTIWNAISTAASAVWETIKDYIINPIATAWDWLVSAFDSIYSGIVSVMRSIAGFFESVWDGIKGIFKSAINFVIGLINGFIDAINFFLGKWNDLMDVLLFEEIFGVSMKIGEIPHIPKLASGGIVKASAGGTLAILGEGGQDEAVIPLPRGASSKTQEKTQNYLMELVNGKFGGMTGYAWEVANRKGLMGENIGAAALANMGGSWSGPPASTSGSLGGWVARAMAITGVPGNWFAPLVSLARHESGGNPNAINLWDSNAAKGTPSIGLFQTIAPTFNAYALPGLGGIRSPVANAVAAIRYILARYGSIFSIASYTPSGFVGGYETGTDFVPRTGMALVHKGEAIIPADENRRGFGNHYNIELNQQRTLPTSRELVDVLQDVDFLYGGGR